MAKLIIYRGDVLDREIELGERTARIGRADDNEIVLTDPTKSVSRLHAELRFNQGQYSVVDLKSQNGVWVAGRRVPTIDLEPGVAVILGSYKLVLKDEQPSAPDFAEAPQFVAPTAQATVLISVPSVAKPAPKAEIPKAPPSVPPPVSVLAAKHAPPPVVAEPVKVEPKPVPPPPPAPPPPPPSAPPAPTAKPHRTRLSKRLVLAALALLLLGGAAAVLFLTPLGARWMGRGK